MKPAAAAQEQVRATELMISNLLRYGVVTSLAIILWGTLVTFVDHPDYFSSPESLQPLTHPESAPHSVSMVVAGAYALHGQAIIMMGLLLLIALPVVRVALSLVIFSSQKDQPFVTITSLVLALLLASFLIGRAAG
jgi:uncharacterized membrane protein